MVNFDNFFRAEKQEQHVGGRNIGHYDNDSYKITGDAHKNQFTLNSNVKNNEESAITISININEGKLHDFENIIISCK